MYAYEIIGLRSEFQRVGKDKMKKYWIQKAFFPLIDKRCDVFFLLQAKSILAKPVLVVKRLSDSKLSMKLTEGTV